MSVNAAQVKTSPSPELTPNNKAASGDIGGANSSRGDPYQDLVVPQLIKIEFFDRGGLMWCAGYISLNAHGLRKGDRPPTSTTAERRRSSARRQSTVRGARAGLRTDTGLRLPLSYPGQTA